jgi:hypothetical protein
MPRFDRLSVIVPTYNRPQFLRSSLRSVARQTARRLITEVIVSENGDCDESELVCREFPQLPIRYVKRAPQLTAAQHFCVLVGEATEDWVAPIGDDDMWSVYHLAEAERLLTEHSSSVAYFGQCVFVNDESRQVRSGYCELLTAEATPSNYERSVVWGLSEMFVETLARASLNMWGMVGRRDALNQAFKAFLECKSPYDADRIMQWRLAQQGTVVIGREVTLFYRLHEKSGCASILKENFDLHMNASRENTETILREARDLGLDTRTIWMSACKSLAENGRTIRERDCVRGAWAVLDQLGWLPSDIVDSRRNLQQDSKLRAILRSLVPPFLLEMARAAFRCLSFGFRKKNSYQK